MSQDGDERPCELGVARIERDELPLHTAFELVHELAEYLSRRFPNVYRVTRLGGKDASGWYGEPGIKEITITPLGKTYSLQDEDPMTVAALL